MPSFGDSKASSVSLSARNKTLSGIAGFTKNDLLSQPIQQTKSDPSRFTNPVREGAGPVTSDSLAAESARSGGKFGENKDSAPLSVEGHKSTFANTNTSGATTLPSSRDAEQRQREEKHAATPPRGQEAAPSGSGGGSAPPQSASTGGGGGHAGVAPSYIDPVLGMGHQKPKGKNLKEGGFDEDPSQNPPGDIGGKMDPGRLAEHKFAAKNAENPLEASLQGGGGGPGAPRKDEQPYSALEPEQEA